MSKSTNWTDILSKYVSYFKCGHLVSLSFPPYPMLKGIDMRLKKNKKYDLFLLFNYTSYKKLISIFESSSKHSTEDSLFIVNNLVPIKKTKKKKSRYWLQNVLNKLLSKIKKEPDTFKFLFYLYKNNYSLCTVYNQEEVFSIIWKSSIKFSYQLDESSLQEISMINMGQYAWLYFPVPYDFSHHYIGLGIDSHLYRTGQEHKKILKA